MNTRILGCVALALSVSTWGYSEEPNANPYAGSSGNRAATGTTREMGARTNKGDASEISSFSFGIRKVELERLENTQDVVHPLAKRIRGCDAEITLKSDTSFVSVSSVATMLKELGVRQLTYRIAQADRGYEIIVTCFPDSRVLIGKSADGLPRSSPNVQEAGELAQEQLDPLMLHSQESTAAEMGSSGVEKPAGAPRLVGDVEFIMHKELQYRTRANPEWKPVPPAGVSKLMGDGQKVVIHVTEEIHHEWVREIIESSKQRKGGTVMVVPLRRRTRNDVRGFGGNNRRPAKPEDQPAKPEARAFPPLEDQPSARPEAPAFPPDGATKGIPAASASGFDK
jgi:hypothetical protein